MGVKRRSERLDAEPEDADVFEDESAGVEALRIWIADGRPWVSLLPPEAMDRPERWGHLLCDALLHIANAYQLTGKYAFEETAERIYDGLHERLREDVTLHALPMDN